MRTVLWLVPLVLTLENYAFVFIQCNCMFRLIKRTATVSYTELNGLSQWKSRVLSVQQGLGF